MAMTKQKKASLYIHLVAIFLIVFLDSQKFLPFL